MRGDEEPLDEGSRAPSSAWHAEIAATFVVEMDVTTRTFSLVNADRTGVLPTHTADTRAARSASNTTQWIVEVAYQATTDHRAIEPPWYGATARFSLGGFTLPAGARSATF
jgi:hypothetical protein